MKIKKIKKAQQEQKKNTTTYTVRNMLNDLLKWDNFLKTIINK
jgi:hypothetical protein